MYEINVSVVLCCQQVFMPSGRMLGGSDSFSNMIYARGNPQDYDVWASMGATGWSYEDVLPYFIKSENNRNSFFKTSRKLLLFFTLLLSSCHKVGLYAMAMSFCCLFICLFVSLLTEMRTCRALV